MQLLLKHGANTELANAVGRRPIHNANDVESLELLLKYGADINSKDMNGRVFWLAIQLLCCWSRSPPVAEYALVLNYQF